jgi:thymidylate synthase
MRIFDLRQELQTKIFNGLHYFPHSLDGEEGLHKEYDKNTIPRRAISLMWNQRSSDTFLGLPFNIASYGLLLEIVAKAVNMVPDELIGNLGDTHLYLNHIEQAKEQIDREPFELPKLGMDYREGEYDKNLTDFVPDDFYLIDYQSHPTIKAPLSN